jgi:hypothetical protein
MSNCSNCSNLVNEKFKLCNSCYMDRSYCRSCGSKNIITLTKRLDNTCATCGSYGFRMNCTGCENKVSVFQMNPFQGGWFCCGDCPSADIQTNRCQNFEKCKRFTSIGFSRCNACSKE